MPSLYDLPPLDARKPLRINYPNAAPPPLPASPPPAPLSVAPAVPRAPASLASLGMTTPPAGAPLAGPAPPVNLPLQQPAAPRPISPTAQNLMNPPRSPLVSGTTPTFGNATPPGANALPKAPLVGRNLAGINTPEMMASRATAAEAYLGGKPGAAGLPPRAPGVPSKLGGLGGFAKSTGLFALGAEALGGITSGDDYVDTVEGRNPIVSTLGRAGAGLGRTVLGDLDRIAGVFGGNQNVQGQFDEYQARENGLALNSTVVRRKNLSDLITGGASDDELRAALGSGGEENRNPPVASGQPFVGAGTPFLPGAGAGAASSQTAPVVAPPGSAAPSPVGNLADNPVVRGEDRAGLLRALGVTEPGEYVNLGNAGGSTAIYGTASKKGGRIDTFSDSPTGGPGGAGVRSGGAQTSPLANAFQSALASMNRNGSGDGAIVNREGMFRDPTGGSRAGSINSRFDERERELRQIFSSPEARGNLAKHLVDLEKLRGDELGADQRGLLDLRGQDIGAGTAFRGQDFGQANSRLATLGGLLENETSNNTSRQNNLQDNIVRARLGELADDRADRRLSSTEDRADRRQEAADKRAAEREALAEARLARADGKTETENMVRGEAAKAAVAKQLGAGDAAKEGAAYSRLSVLPADVQDFVGKANPASQARAYTQAGRVSEEVDKGMPEGGRDVGAMAQNAALGGLVGGKLAPKALGALGSAIDLAIGAKIPGYKGKHVGRDLLGNRAAGAGLGALAGAFGITQPVKPQTNISLPQTNVNAAGQEVLTPASPNWREYRDLGAFDMLRGSALGDLGRTENGRLILNRDQFSSDALQAALELKDAQRRARAARGE